GVGVPEDLRPRAGHLHLVDLVPQLRVRGRRWAVRGLFLAAHLSPPRQALGSPAAHRKPTIRPMQWTFATHLARYGPDSTLPPPTPAQARQYVRLVTHSHYENFSVASSLLPARLR